MAYLSKLGVACSEKTASLVVTTHQEERSILCEALNRGIDKAVEEHLLGRNNAHHIAIEEYYIGLFLGVVVEQRLQLILIRVNIVQDDKLNRLILRIEGFEVRSTLAVDVGASHITVVYAVLLNLEYLLRVYGIAV